MFIRCAKGHISPEEFEDQQTDYCYECGEVVDVTATSDPEELMAAAEAETDLGWRHMLADQAILAMLRPSASDFVERYEALESRFFYS